MNSSAASVSAAFLLAALSRFAPAAEEANLLHNPGFEEASASPWRLPKEFAIDAAVAHSGTRSLRLIQPGTGSYPLASQAIDFRAGRQYRYSAWIKTQGVAGAESGATLCMEWSGPKGWLGGAYADGKKGDQDWFRIEGITAPLPPEATGIHVSLYLRKGMTGTAWFDDVEVAPYFASPLDAALLQPNYRGRLEASAKDQRIIVRARIAQDMKSSLTASQTTLVATLLTGETAVQEQRQKSPAAGVHDLVFQASSLPTGDHRVRVELRSPDGAALGRHEFDLHKLPPNAPQPAVFLDPQNRTIIGGKPFFPLGWYFGPGPGAADYASHLDRVAQSGFNTIMCYGISAGGIDKVRTYLDALAARNLKLIYSIKDVYAGTKYYHEPVLGFRGDDAIVRGVVSAFRNHPALLAWYLNDEMPLSMRDRLDARHSLVRSLDPDHPTWSVLYQVDEFAGYLNSADVLGADPYPVPTKPATLAADWTKKCAAVADGMRPLWMVPQAFDWATYHPDRTGNSRAPTLDEELVMSYLCLIHGAHGLIYYSYFDLQRDPLGFEQRWADMATLGQELNRLMPALLAAKPATLPEIQTTAPAVQFAARSDDAGRRYILLANPSPDTPARVGVAVGPGSAVQQLFHGALQPAPPPAAGICTITLKPMTASTLLIDP